MLILFPWFTIVCSKTRVILLSEFHSPVCIYTLVTYIHTTLLLHSIVAYSRPPMLSCKSRAQRRVAVKHWTKCVHNSVTSNEHCINAPFFFSALVCFFFSLLIRLPSFFISYLQVDTLDRQMFWNGLWCMSCTNFMATCREWTVFKNIFS